MATTLHVSDVAELLSEGRTHFNLSRTSGRALYPPPRSDTGC